MLEEGRRQQDVLDEQARFSAMVGEGIRKVRGGKGGGSLTKVHFTKETSKLRTKAFC